MLAAARKAAAAAATVEEAAAMHAGLKERRAQLAVARAQLRCGRMLRRAPQATCTVQFYYAESQYVRSHLSETVETRESACRMRHVSS